MSILLFSHHKSVTADGVLNQVLPPPPQQRPPQRPPQRAQQQQHQYLPSLAWLCLVQLADFPDQVHHLGLRLNLHSDAPLVKDVLSCVHGMSPQFWATLVQLYDNLPPRLSSYASPLSDPLVPLLQRIPSTEHFSLLTVLDLPACPHLTDDSIHALKSVHTLTAFDASATSISPYAIDVLARTLLWSDDYPQQRRGPWPLRILRLRYCTNIDNKVYPHLLRFPLLSVIDLRGTHSVPNSSLHASFPPASTSQLSLYHPSSLTAALQSLSSSFSLYSSPHTYTLHINSLYHTPLSQPLNTIAPQDTYVVVPSANTNSKLTIGDSEVLRRRAEKRDKRLQHEQNKLAWYARNPRIDDHDTWGDLHDYCQGSCDFSEERDHPTRLPVNEVSYSDSDNDPRDSCDALEIYDSTDSEGSESLFEKPYTIIHTPKSAVKKEEDEHVIVTPSRSLRPVKGEDKDKSIPSTSATILRPSLKSDKKLLSSSWIGGSNARQQKIFTLPQHTKTRVRPMPQSIFASPSSVTRPHSRHHPSIIHPKNISNTPENLAPPTPRNIPRNLTVTENQARLPPSAAAASFYSNKNPRGAPRSSNKSKHVSDWHYSAEEYYSRACRDGEGQHDALLMLYREPPAWSILDAAAIISPGDARRQNNDVVSMKCAKKPAVELATIDRTQIKAVRRKEGDQQAALVALQESAKRHGVKRRPEGEARDFAVNSPSVLSGRNPFRRPVDVDPNSKPLKPISAVKVPLLPRELRLAALEKELEELEASKASPQRSSYTNGSSSSSRSSSVIIAKSKLKPTDMRMRVENEAFTLLKRSTNLEKVEPRSKKVKHSDSAPVMGVTKKLADTTRVEGKVKQPCGNKSFNWSAWASK